MSFVMGRLDRWWLNDWKVGFGLVGRGWWVGRYGCCRWVGSSMCVGWVGGGRWYRGWDGCWLTDWKMDVGWVGWW